MFDTGPSPSHKTERDGRAKARAPFPLSPSFITHLNRCGPCREGICKLVRDSSCQRQVSGRQIRDESSREQVPGERLLIEYKKRGRAELIAVEAGALEAACACRRVRCTKMVSERRSVVHSRTAREEFGESGATGRANAVTNGILSRSRRRCVEIRSPATEERF